MRQRTALLAVCGSALALSACGLFDRSPVCTDVLEPGIALLVRDSITNSSPGLGSLVIATEGAWADTAHSTGGVYYLAYERVGTYTLSVQHTGYQPWTRSGVQVSRDACHVITVNVTARLQK